MPKSDIRFKRVNDDYPSARNAQDKTFGEQAQELIEAVKRNNDMLDAIIEHLDIPFQSRPIAIKNPRFNGR